MYAPSFIQKANINQTSSNSSNMLPNGQISNSMNRTPVHPTTDRSVLHPHLFQNSLILSGGHTSYNHHLSMNLVPPPSLIANYPLQVYSVGSASNYPLQFAAPFVFPSNEHAAQFGMYSESHPLCLNVHRNLLPVEANETMITQPQTVIAANYAQTQHKSVNSTDESGLSNSTNLPLANSPYTSLLDRTPIMSSSQVLPEISSSGIQSETEKRRSSLGTHIGAILTSEASTSTKCNYSSQIEHCSSAETVQGLTSVFKKVVASTQTEEGNFVSRNDAISTELATDGIQLSCQEKVPTAGGNCVHCEKFKKIGIVCSLHRPKRNDPHLPSYSEDQSEEQPYNLSSSNQTKTDSQVENDAFHLNVESNNSLPTISSSNVSLDFLTRNEKFINFNLPSSGNIKITISNSLHKNLPANSNHLVTAQASEPVNATNSSEQLICNSEEMIRENSVCGQSEETISVTSDFVGLSDNEIPSPELSSDRVESPFNAQMLSRKNKGSEKNSDLLSLENCPPIAQNNLMPSTDPSVVNIGKLTNVFFLNPQNSALTVPVTSSPINNSPEQILKQNQKCHKPSKTLNSDHVLRKYNRGTPKNQNSTIVVTTSNPQLSSTITRCNSALSVLEHSLFQLQPENTEQNKGSTKENLYNPFFETESVGLVSDKDKLHFTKTCDALSSCSDNSDLGIRNSSVSSKSYQPCALNKWVSDSAGKSISKEHNHLPDNPNSILSSLSPGFDHHIPIVTEKKTSELFSISNNTECGLIVTPIKRKRGRPKRLPGMETKNSKTSEKNISKITNSRKRRISYTEQKGGIKSDGYESKNQSSNYVLPKPRRGRPKKATYLELNNNYAISTKNLHPICVADTEKSKEKSGGYDVSSEVALFSNDLVNSSKQKVSCPKKFKCLRIDKKCLQNSDNILPMHSVNTKINSSKQNLLYFNGINNPMVRATKDLPDCSCKLRRKRRKKFVDSAVDSKQEQETIPNNSKNKLVESSNNLINCPGQKRGRSKRTNISTLPNIYINQPTKKLKSSLLPVHSNAEVNLNGSKIFQSTSDFNLADEEINSSSPTETTTESVMTDLNSESFRFIDSCAKLFTETNPNESVEKFTLSKNLLFENTRIKDIFTSSNIIEKRKLKRNRRQLKRIKKRVTERQQDENKITKSNDKTLNEFCFATPMSHTDLQLINESFVLHTTDRSIEQLCNLDTDSELLSVSPVVSPTSLGDGNTISLSIESEDSCPHEQSMIESTVAISEKDRSIMQPSSKNTDTELLSRSPMVLLTSLGDCNTISLENESKNSCLHENSMNELTVVSEKDRSIKHLCSKNTDSELLSNSPMVLLTSLGDCNTIPLGNESKGSCLHGQSMNELTVVSEKDRLIKQLCRKNTDRELLSGSPMVLHTSLGDCNTISLGNESEGSCLHEHSMNELAAVVSEKDRSITQLGNKVTGSELLSCSPMVLGASLDDCNTISKGNESEGSCLHEQSINKFTVAIREKYKSIMQLSNKNTDSESLSGSPMVLRTSSCDCNTISLGMENEDLCPHEQCMNALTVPIIDKDNCGVSAAAADSKMVSILNKTSASFSALDLSSGEYNNISDETESQELLPYLHYKNEGTITICDTGNYRISSNKKEKNNDYILKEISNNLSTIHEPFDSNSISIDNKCQPQNNTSTIAVIDNNNCHPSSTEKDGEFNTIPNEASNFFMTHSIDDSICISRNNKCEDSFICEQQINEPTSISNTANFCVSSIEKKKDSESICNETSIDLTAINSSIDSNYISVDNRCVVLIHSKPDINESSNAIKNTDSRSTEKVGESETTQSEVSSFSTFHLNEGNHIPGDDLCKDSFLCEQHMSESIVTLGKADKCLISSTKNDGESKSVLNEASTAFLMETPREMQILDNVAKTNSQTVGYSTQTEESQTNRQTIFIPVQTDESQPNSLSVCNPVQTDESQPNSLSICNPVQTDESQPDSLNVCNSVQTDEYQPDSLTVCNPVQTDESEMNSLTMCNSVQIAEQKLNPESCELKGLFSKWRRQEVISAESVEVYYYPPFGQQKLKSRAEVRSYCKKYNIEYRVDMFNFQKSSFTSYRKPKQRKYGPGCTLKAKYSIKNPFSVTGTVADIREKADLNKPKILNANSAQKAVINGLEEPRLLIKDDSKILENGFITLDAYHSLEVEVRKLYEPYVVLRPLRSSPQLLNPQRSSQRKRHPPIIINL